MKLICGLGNPGKKYAHTKHNVGFLLLDRYARENNFKIDTIKFKSLMAKVNIRGEQVIFLKPQTYMNLSGEAIRDVINYFKIDLEDVLIIYDDIDIEVGTIRIRKKGSAGTHNGMRNILYHLRSEDFPRMRIGISRDKKIDLKIDVLNNFSKEEALIINKVFDASVKAIDEFIVNGVDSTMNKFNGKVDV